MVNKGEIFTPGDRVFWHGRPVGSEWGTVIHREIRTGGRIPLPFLHIIFDDAHEEWVLEGHCVHDPSDYIPF